MKDLYVKAKDMYKYIRKFIYFGWFYATLKLMDSYPHFEWWKKDFGGCASYWLSVFCFNIKKVPLKVKDIYIRVS